MKSCDSTVPNSSFSRLFIIQRMRGKKQHVGGGIIGDGVGLTLSLWLRNAKHWPRGHQQRSFQPLLASLVQWLLPHSVPKSTAPGCTSPGGAGISFALLFNSGRAASAPAWTWAGRWTQPTPPASTLQSQQHTCRAGESTGIWMSSSSLCGSCWLCPGQVLQRA